MLGLGKTLPLSRKLEGAAYPPILDDGNTVKWFDFMENISKDGSGFVWSWDNKSGITGIIAGALLQAVGTNQPLWTADGVSFDGVDNFMKTATFTLVQPEKIYIVFKHVTWTLNDWIFDGNSSSTGRLGQRTVTPNLQSYAGAASAENSNLTLNTLGVVRVLFNGVNSSLQVNETAKWTGDAGASNMGGFTLGALGGLSGFAHIVVKEIIIRKVADTTENEAIIYAYLKSKYGL